ncbi:ead/Ea22-like family protein [Citrobacter freundii]|uniref:ead/Ea22-like family protein n=1 Tax=Citrobacter freundii TaxID=546 RepID=UPI001495F571|nr:ead/Ea22-like family protein [Citrobacter freundii]
MTALNKQALREAAEKALPAMKRLLMMPNDELFDEVLLNVDGDVDAANAFNLIAGPENMLALLDELEAAEKRIAEQQETLNAARSYVKSHAAEDGHAFGVLQAIDRAAGIGVKGE